VNGRRAFSLTEVLVALAIIAFALIPIVTMSSTTTKQAVFSEYHVFFQARAMRVLQHYSILPYRDLAMLATGPDGAIHVTLTDPPIPHEFRRKLKTAIEVLEFKELEPGLGKLTATMQWRFPTDTVRQADKIQHQVVMVRFVTDGTWSVRAREGLDL